MLGKNSIETVFEKNRINFRMKETIYDYYYKLKLNACEFDINLLFEFFSEVSDRDELSINIHYTDEQSCVIKDMQDYEEAQSVYNEIRDYFEVDDELLIEINVKKGIKNNTISIYDLKQFKQVFLKNNIFDFLDMCKVLYSKSSERLNFETLNDNIYIQSEFFSIIPLGKDISFRKSYRETIKENSIGICNLESPFELPFTPQDFDVYDYDTSIESEEIKSYFENIKFILSIFYIVDYSKITRSSIYFSIAGYRKTEKTIDLSKAIKPNPVFYKIYKWLYSGGNIYDKVQIARNILTLHCRYSDILEIDASIIETIQSNYNLYLKDNVKDYLQLKKDITESIIDHCNSISEAINKLAGYFKGNFIAIFGFIATLYFSEGIKANGFVNLFTGQTAIVASLVLAGSLVWMFVSIGEVCLKKQFYSKKVESLKQNYVEVVEKGELSKLIDKNDLLILADKQYKYSTIAIGVIWFVLIVLLFLALDFLSGDVKLLFFWNNL
jgi:hypothetical protein